MSSLNNRNLLQMCSRFPDQNMALGNFAAGSPVMQRHTGKATRQIGALTEIDLAEFFGVSLDIVGDFGIAGGELQFAVMGTRGSISIRPERRLALRSRYCDS